MSSKLLNYPSASSNPHLATGSSAAGSAAGSRNGSHGSSQLNFENLQLDDILCTVCQSVLVEPVFLPCQHRFCRNCLSGTIEKNNLNCPCCRKRFGTWYRNASRVNKLVHEQLWSAIQSQFRDYLEEDGARCNGNGSSGACFVPQSESVIRLSEPGEIRKEYENELQRYRKELIAEKKKELAASEKYIINLYKQEGIIDLVDSSDHLSISSSTSTPEHERKQEQEQLPAATSSDIHDVDDDEEAGPSGSAFTQPKSIAAINSNQLSNSTQQSSNVISSSQVNTSRTETSKSVSNGSVISISSTSSASAASSSCISSTSSRYSLIKSAQQTAGGGHAEAGKQKSQHSILNKLTSAGGSKKIFTMADLNKSELCVKPTKLHRKSSSNDEDDDADDGDSLRSELNHFKPIIATTPKSCFSPKAIIRVPSIRPENAGSLPSTSTGVAMESLSPSKSPFKPIDPLTPRRSAFSVVNVHLLTPPSTSGCNENSQQQQRNRLAKKSSPPSADSSKGSVASASKRQTKKKQNSQQKVKPKRGSASQRKRKLDFSPQVNNKVKPSPSTKPATEPAKSSRITRQSLNSEAVRLKELIVTDQQRRAAMIEQERSDFEFAKKLQKKLNRTRGAAALLMEPIGIESVLCRSDAYSLRQKTTFTTIQASVSYHPALNSDPASLEPPAKRRTMAVPPVAAAKQDKSTRKQPRKTMPPKLIKQEPAEDVAEEEGSCPVRRSTRNRH